MRVWEGCIQATRVLKLVEVRVGASKLGQGNGKVFALDAPGALALELLLESTRRDRAHSAEGSNWPQGGEIDIMEGINMQTTDQIALHTEGSG
jgi:hypothetical protein